MKHPARRHIAAPQYILAGDETGQTGSNLADKTQPLFVNAAWLYPASKSALLSELAAPLRKELPKDVKELASGYFLTKASTARRLLLADWLEGMFKNGIIPTFYIADRRYAIGGKIVQTLLDPGTNDAAEGVINLGDEAERESAYAFFSEMSEDCLDEFARAYRSLERLEMESAVGTLIVECEKRGDGQLAAALTGSLTHLGYILECETRSSPAKRALNYPAFLWLLRFADQMIENRERALGRKGGRVVVSVVHDRQREFEAAFREGVQFLRRVGPVSSAIYGAGPVGRLGLSVIDGRHLEFPDSKGRIEIQAADLLAGAVRRMINLSREDVPWDKVELPDRRMMWVLLPLLAEDLSGGLFGPERLKERLLERYLSFAEYLSPEERVRIPRRPPGWRDLSRGRQK